MLKVETNYANGIPQTAVPGFAPTGQAMHWTAGGTGRSGALATIQHFINTRYTVNASYHILVWWDATAQVTGAMWIVPPSKAAHSLAPSKAYQYNVNKDRALQDAWFAEVRRILGVKAADPNAGCIAVSFCGMPADLAAAMKSPVFVADMKRLMADLQTISSMLRRPLFNHGWIQPINRYDAGEVLIPALYGEDDDMRLSGFKPIINRKVTLKAGATARTTPNFNPKAYDENKIVTHGGTVTRIAVAEVQGSNITLSNGTVINKDTRWIMTDSSSNDNVFYHWQDVGTMVAIEKIEVVKEVVKEVPTGISEEDVKQARLEAAGNEKERIALAEAERIRTT